MKNLRGATHHIYEKPRNRCFVASLQKNVNYLYNKYSFEDYVSRSNSHAVVMYHLPPFKGEFGLVERYCFVPVYKSSFSIAIPASSFSRQHQRQTAGKCTNESLLSNPSLLLGSSREYESILHPSIEVATYYRDFF